MSDSRVEKLERAMRTTLDHEGVIRAMENAGLVVLDLDDPKVRERVALAMFEDRYGFPLSRVKHPASYERGLADFKRSAHTVLSALAAKP